MDGQKTSILRAVGFASAVVGLGIVGTAFWKHVVRLRALGLPAEHGPVKTLKNLSLLTTDSLSQEELEYLLERAKAIRAGISAGRDPMPPARTVVIGLLFFEPSTRTRCSFEAAAKRLGLSTLSICDLKSSSTTKGEGELDTAKVMEQYCNAIVVRHPEKGMAAKLAKELSVPVFNAGDGTGEHPSQALLDLLTIDNAFHSRLWDFTEAPVVVTLLGDLKLGRTVHSLTKLLSRFNVKLQVLPIPSFDLPADIIDAAALIAAKYNPYSVTPPAKVDDLITALKTSDVIYATRFQKERCELGTAANYNHLQITSALLDKYSPTHQIVSVYSLESTQMPISQIMHPLPRNEEISPCVDANHRQRYFEQVGDGMYMRMAILESYLGVHLP